MRTGLPTLLAWLLLATVAWGKPETFNAAKLLSEGQGFGSGRWAVVSRGTTYLVEGRGRISVSGGRSAKLPLDENCFVSKRVYAYSRADELLLWYEESDVDSAGGRMVCLDANTLRLRWEVEIPAFNIGQPLVERDVVYVTGYGTAARIDLSRGSVTWIVENLGKEQGETIYSFRVPEFKGDRLILRADVHLGTILPLRGKVLEPGYVEIERRTGKVLTVRPTKTAGR